MQIRLIIWFTISLVGSIILFSEMWLKLPQWLSPDGLQRYGVFHWGVLGLCILWLWLKRKDIASRMQTARFSLPFILGGLALLALSIFLPRSDNFLVFLVILGGLGIFTLMFSRASIIPAILLAIYGFSVAFPILATRWLGESSAVLVTNTVIAITTALGLPIASNGLVLQFDSLSGDTIRTAIVPDCAGYATIGVFIALFSLMMLDIRLPLRKAWWVFLFGLLGTWLQNIIRIEVSVAAAYYWGPGALEAAHYNIAYVIFPLWFTLFAFIYLKQAGWRGVPAKNRNLA